MTREKKMFWQLQFNRAYLELKKCTPDFKPHFKALMVRAIQCKIATEKRGF